MNYDFTEKLTEASHPHKRLKTFPQHSKAIKDLELMWHQSRVSVRTITFISQTTTLIPLFINVYIFLLIFFLVEIDLKDVVIQENIETDLFCMMSIQVCEG